jgi:uncharacterized protein with HEPN domain
MKKDYLLLNHIFDSILKIEEFTDSITKEDFIQDDKTNLALIRLLEIIGEAANHISQETLQQTTDIPWKDIIGFRNILIHEYFNIDLDIVWKTIQVNIPQIKNSIQIYLEKQKL